MSIASKIHDLVDLALGLTVLALGLGAIFAIGLQVYEYFTESDAPNTESTLASNQQTTKNNESTNTSSSLGDEKIKQIKGVLKNNPAITYHYIKRQAEQGNAKAQYLLGTMYLNGTGTKKNPDKAMKILLIAAKQGVVDAQYKIGDMYYSGDGITQNFKKAFPWIQKAAKQGNERAQSTLGMMYYHGRGIPSNPKKTAKWLRKAANQGGAYAQFNMGILYRDGTGVTRDKRKAEAWFRKSAAQGYKHAKKQIALMTKKQIAVNTKNKRKTKEYKLAFKTSLANVEELEYQCGYADMYNSRGNGKRSRVKVFPQLKARTTISSFKRRIRLLDSNYNDWVKCVNKFNKPYNTAYQSIRWLSNNSNTKRIKLRKREQAIDSQYAYTKKYRSRMKKERKYWIDEFITISRNKSNRPKRKQQRSWIEEIGVGLVQAQREQERQERQSSMDRFANSREGKKYFAKLDQDIRHYERIEKIEKMRRSNSCIGGGDIDLDGNTAYHFIYSTCANCEPGGKNGRNKIGLVAFVSNVIFERKYDHKSTTGRFFSKVRELYPWGTENGNLSHGYKLKKCALAKRDEMISDYRSKDFTVKKIYWRTH